MACWMVRQAQLVHLLPLSFQHPSQHEQSELWTIPNPYPHLHSDLLFHTTLTTLQRMMWTPHLHAAFVPSVRAVIRTTLLCQARASTLAAVDAETKAEAQRDGRVMLATDRREPGRSRLRDHHAYFILTHTSQPPNLSAHFSIPLIPPYPTPPRCASKHGPAGSNGLG